jgi:hypothetical protein
MVNSHDKINTKDDDEPVRIMLGGTADGWMDGWAGAYMYV